MAFDFWVERCAVHRLLDSAVVAIELVAGLQRCGDAVFLIPAFDLGLIASRDLGVTLLVDAVLLIGRDFRCDLTPDVNRAAVLKLDFFCLRTVW